MPHFRRDWLWALLLILFVILAYTPTWHAGFIWDDDIILTYNPCIVGPFGLKEIWTTAAADICPLVLTTFWVEHELWGLAPLPYHLVNIVMHGACAILLWRVLCSLGVPGAWLGAALWALHPVMVESVAWITEMKNTESGLFFLLSILFFVKWLKTEEPNEEQADDGVTPDVGRVASPRRPPLTGGSEIRPYRARVFAYMLSLLFAALAMASKSSTVILPVVLCLCAWWIEGRWQWRNVARVAPMLLMSVAAGAVSIWTQGLQLATAAGDPQWVRPWPQRLAAAGDAVWFYLGKLLWPDPLITIYPRWQIDASQWVSYLPLLAVILLFFILWLKLRSGVAGSRACFFALAYFLTALLPVLGLIDNSIFRYSLVFDHLQYLASIGPLALAGAGLTRVWDLLLSPQCWPKGIGVWAYGRIRLRQGFVGQVGVGAGTSKNLWLQPAFCAGLLLILGLLTWQRTRIYESTETFWSDTLAKNPNSWVGHNNLGFALFQKGHADEAISHFQKALEVNPNYKDAHNNLANALLQKRRLDEAICEYQKTLEIEPSYAAGHFNLGVALSQKGQVDAAIFQYQKAIEINPNFLGAYTNLGNTLFQRGDFDEAITQYQKALEINPSDAEVHANLGNVLFQKGQFKDAITQFQEALRLNPNLRPVRASLARAKAFESQK